MKRSRIDIGAFLVGEMGTGKTTVAAAAAVAKRALVLCPPHLVEKWRREIEATVEDATVIIAGRVGSRGGSSW